MTLFKKKSPRRRRLVLVLGIALLCLAPIVGTLGPASDLSARPNPAEVTHLPGPGESR